MKRRGIIIGIIVALLGLIGMLSGGIISAQFPPAPPGEEEVETYTLAVEVEPEDAGGVSLDPSQPSEGYELGTVVTLTAEPSEGYEFNRWTGDAWGTASMTTVVMTSAKKVTAHFKTMRPSVEKEEGKPEEEKEKPPAEEKEIELSEITKAIPEEVMAQIEQLEKLRAQLESELDTAKTINETKIKDLEVAGLFAQEAVKEAKAGNLEKAKELANNSINLLIKIAQGNKEGAKTIEAYAKAIDDLAEAIEHLMSVVSGGY